MADTLYLVDASGFIFRAYHALPPLRTKGGTPTGAVYGFAQMLIRLEQEYRPTHLCVVFDAPGPSFRDEIYPQYKAHRPPTPEDLIPQFELVRQVVAAFGVPNIEAAGFEADDVIATLTRRAQARGMRVVIVSSDKDLMQLVGDDVELLDTLNQKTRHFGPREVEEKYGVPPARLGDLLALMGDAVDNVPGVPGVGPKTAAALLQAFPDLTALLARCDEIVNIPGLRGAKSVRDKIAAHRDAALLSRRLVALREDVALEIELDALRRPEPPMKRVEHLLRDLEFNALLGRLAPAGGTEETASAAPLGGAAATTSGPPSAPPASALPAIAAPGPLAATVFSHQELMDQLAAFGGEAALGLEVVVLGGGASAPLIGLALASSTRAIYVPLGHRYLGAPTQLAAAAVLATLAPLLSDAARHKAVHAHKTAHLVCEQYGIALRGVTWDPELAAYLLDPAQPHDLAPLAERVGFAAATPWGGRTVEEREAICGSGKKAVPIDTVEISRVALWAAPRAQAALVVGQRLAAEVAGAGMQRLLDEVELPLGRVLAIVERHGVRLDVQHLARLGAEIEQKLAGIADEVRALAGYEVNLGSPKQLQELLFEKLQLPAGKKTKTGFSTDAEVLEELAPLHPIAAKIHQHRGLAKLKSTYIDALPQQVDARTGRLHTSYQQTVAATGRLSSKEPNLQNIPIRSELGRDIRRAFIADPGHHLIAADYSQIELRVLAHLSGDPVLTDAFLRGQDVHSRTACEMFHVGEAAVTAEMRRIAKAINFGIIYGQTDYGLARAVGIGRDEARKYIAGYFERYAVVKTFMEQLIEQARRDGGARTLLGRFRPLPDLQSGNRGLRQYAERMARNTPIQGTAADLLKLAMIAVEERIEREAPRARMLLTVHDELVLEAPIEEAVRVGEIAAETMGSVHRLAVPLHVDVGTGATWADC